MLDIIFFIHFSNFRHSIFSIAKKTADHKTTANQTCCLFYMFMNNFPTFIEFLYSISEALCKHYQEKIGSFSIKYLKDIHTHYIKTTRTTLYKLENRRQFRGYIHNDGVSVLFDLPKLLFGS